MISVFSSIIDALIVGIKFIGSFFSGILSVFSLLGDCWTFLTMSWFYMPAPLLVFAVAGLSICIVYQLIGR